MFYSHEILTSSQHGVATIWLAATVGKGSTVGKGAARPLTRKAVEEVNVPKACATIIDPGAPLALRLQSSLLYGVSRVFSQQCTYVLSDAGRVQSNMMTFFRVLQTTAIDPKAGQTKRQNITLEDDPSFDLLGALPNFDLLRGGETGLFGVPSQGSTNKYSQMTPCRPSQASLSSNSNNQALLPFDFPSSFCAGSFRIPSDFGQQESPLAHKARGSDAMPEFRPFAEDELDPIHGTALDFDADGNLIGIFDQEPQLPNLPITGVEDPPVPNDNVITAGAPGEQPFPDGGEQADLALEHTVLADAVGSAVQQPTESYAKLSVTTETEQASAHNRPARRRKAALMLDQVHHISRPEIRSWDANYVENMSACRKRPRTTTPAQAKKNAHALIYGNRIAGVGLVQDIFGVTHPLAEQFSGQMLRAELLGLDPSEVGAGAENKMGRRRKLLEALGEDVVGQAGHRNVKPRIEEDAEMGRGDGQNDGAFPSFGDDTAPEAGLDAAAPMDDRHSSSMMPWSRPGSVARGQGSARKPAHTPSPLHGRGSVLGSIERHSDAAEATLAFGAAGVGPTGSSIDLEDGMGALVDNGNDTQGSSAGLDAASQAFLEYAAAAAAEKGTLRGRHGEARRWVQFDELASPDAHGKGVAAQAFLHVLSLASKGVVAVHQEGVEDKQPFGAIHVGFPVKRSRAESADELA